MILYCQKIQRSQTDAGVAEQADARDLKSRGSNPVPVRSRSPAPHGHFSSGKAERRLTAGQTADTYSSTSTVEGATYNRVTLGQHQPRVPKDMSRTHGESMLGMDRHRAVERVFRLTYRGIAKW